MTTHAPELHAQVLELYREGKGYKRISREVGMARETVRDMVQRAVAAGELEARPTRTAAGAALRAAPGTHARGKLEVSFQLPEDWDPAGGSPLDYWSGRLRYAEAYAQAAMEVGNTAAAGNWGRQAAEARKQLDKARAAERDELERQDRADQRDPEVLASRVLEVVPALVRLAPEAAVRIRNQLTAELERSAEDG